MNKQAVIDVLNEVRQSELTSLSQYMAHYYTLRSLGYPQLASESKLESVDEMKHAELLAIRIIDLEGDPEYKPLNPPHKKGTVEEMVSADIGLEEEAIDRLNSGIKICYDNNDTTSRSLLEVIIKDEEQHLYELKQHLDHIKKFGNDYLIKFAGTGEQG